MFDGIRASMRLVVCMLGVLAAVGVAACGSSDDSGSDESSSSSSASKDLTGAALKFVGGKAGAASSDKPPVTIGFVNQSGGVPAFPEAAAAADAAVKLVNDELGGIQGHPLRLASCTIVSAEEQGQACGQKLLAQSGVKVVTTGGVDVGSASLFSTLGSKLFTVGANINGEADIGAKNAVFMASGVVGVVPNLGVYAAQNLKAKTAALLVDATPQGQVAAKLIKDVLKASGVKVTESQFKPNSPSLTGPVSASGAAKADVVIAVVLPQTCIPLSKTLEQLGVKAPVLTLGLCLDESVKKAAGDYPKWTYSMPTDNPALPEESDDVADYLTAMEKYAPKAAVQGQSPMTFAAILTDARILNELGPEATPKEVADKAATFAADGYMGAPDLHCGQNKATPSICTLGVRLYTYEGNDKWVDATGGKWVSPPPPPSAK